MSKLRELYIKQIKPFIPKKVFRAYDSLKRRGLAGLPAFSTTLPENNDLVQYFKSNQRNLIHKWDHYFEIYDRHFSRFREKEIVILEVGIYHGGSLQMWKHYFGEKAKIYAIDINPECKKFEEDQIEIFIGSQEDREFLRSIREKIPKVDILIDDGGHTMNQQIVTFKELYGHVKEDGVYLCEDLHTSYWEEYGGGYKKSGSFIEYSKNFIDALHAWHSREDALSVSDFTRITKSLHYYDSVLVLEKGHHPKPTEHMTGKPSL